MASQYVPSFQGGGAGGTVALPGASPDAFGAPVGAGIADLGEAANKLAIAEKKKEVEQDASDASVNLARFQGDLETKITAAREAAPPGAKGHADTVGQTIDQGLADLRKGYEGASPRVLQMIDEQGATLRSRLVAREAGWESGQRIDKQVGDVRDAGDVRANVLGMKGNAGNGVALSDALRDTRQALEHSVPPSMVEPLFREQARALTVSWLKGYVPDNPQAVHGMVGQATVGAPAPSGKFAGQLAPGNIDLAHRPVVKSDDGTIATVRSISTNIDGKEVLIPTVVDGRVVSDDDAIAHYKATGENLGTFDTPEHATAYAEALHQAQDKFYTGGGSTPNPLMQWLDPKDLPAIRGAAEAEIHRQEAEQRRQEALQRAQLAQARAEVGERWSLFQARIKKGDDPADAEWDTMQHDLSIFKFPTDTYNIGALREQRNWGKETSTWTAPDFQHNLDQLSAIAPDKRTPVQSRRLAWLQDKVGDARKEKPEDYATRNGMPAPALDWSDPSTFDKRAQWANALQTRFPGKPAPYLTQDEMPVVKQMLSGGVNEQLNAFGLLHRFGPAVAGIVRQATGDESMAIASTLPHDSAVLYLQGADALKANPKLVDHKALQDVWREVQPGIPGYLQEAVRGAAVRIYASRMAQIGESEWNEGRFRYALQQAVGGSGSGDGFHGGLQTWNGRLTVLPSDMTKGDFESRISRASPQEIVAAAGGHSAFWAGNRPVKASEFKQLELVPVRMGGSVYRVQDHVGRLIIDGHGQPFQVDVSRLPQRVGR